MPGSPHLKCAIRCYRHEYWNDMYSSSQVTYYQQIEQARNPKRSALLFLNNELSFRLIWQLAGLWKRILSPCLWKKNIITGAPKQISPGAPTAVVAPLWISQTFDYPKKWSKFVMNHGSTWAWVCFEALYPDTSIFMDGKDINFIINDIILKTTMKNPFFFFIHIYILPKHFGIFIFWYFWFQC